MTGRKGLYLFVGLCLACATAFGQQAAASSSASPSKAKSLTLEDCIVQAVKSNLGVSVAVIDPEVARLAVSRAKEKFLPSLAFTYGQQNTNSPSYSFIQAAQQLTTVYSDYNAEIDQNIPTGGKLAVYLDTYKNDSNANFQTINPYYASTLSFSFTQPLLRDFGFTVSRREILVAQNNRSVAESEFRAYLMTTVYNVEQAYWNLVYSIDGLEVRRQALALAQDLLDKTEKEIDVGSMAPKEVLSARAEVALRKADILQAESMVKDATDTLRTLLNLPGDEAAAELVPAEKPSVERVDLGLEEALGLARENRPDLEASRVDIRTKDLDLLYARNQLLPALNLKAGYWSPGVAGTQILYQDNNPLTGVVIGTIPGDASGALRDALGFKFRNWSVLLSLDVPLNTVVSRAAAAQAKLDLDQSSRKLAYLEQQAELEVKTALRAVQTDYERVQAYASASDLAAQKLAAEEAKLKAGLSTNYFVLQYQRDLTQARSSELAAIVDYKLARAQLDKATGMILKNHSIQVPEAGK